MEMCNYYKAMSITEQKAYCSAGTYGCAVFTTAQENTNYDKQQMAGVTGAPLCQTKAFLVICFLSQNLYLVLSTIPECVCRCHLCPHCVCVCVCVYVCVYYILLLSTGRSV